MTSSQRQLIRAWTVLFALAGSTASFAVPIVDTDFEPPLNFVGNLNLQYSSGPNPWTSTFGTITDLGFYLDTQAAHYGNNLTPNVVDAHSYVNLGAVVIPAGRKLRAKVDIYMDPAEPTIFTGLVAYANGHTNELGYFGGRGDGFKGGLHGTDNSALVLGHIQNPVDGGWNRIGLEIEQISPTTLSTTYTFNGVEFKWDGATTNTHIDTAGNPNLVSDIALFSMNMGGTDVVGHGYYDNLWIGIVPEPGTAVLLVLGAGMGAMRRRKARRGG